MMGGVSPETCWASYKYGIIKFWYIVASCWIFSLWIVLWCMDTLTSSWKQSFVYTMVIWQTTNGTQDTKGMESLTYCKAVQSQIYGHIWPAMSQNMGQKNLVIKPINTLYWEIIPNCLQFVFYKFWPFMNHENLQVYSIVIHLPKGSCRRQSVHSYRLFPNKVGLFAEFVLLPIIIILLLLLLLLLLQHYNSFWVLACSCFHLFLLLACFFQFHIFKIFKSRCT